MTLYDPIEQKVDYQKFRNGRIWKPSITGRSDADAELTCTYAVWIYEDGHIDIITRLYCEAGGVAGGGSDGYGGGYGGGGIASPSSPSSEVNPCDKIKKLKEDPNYINALAYLKTRFKEKEETGFYISESAGYVPGIPKGMFQLSGTRYADTYGIIHVHQDSFTYLLPDGVTQSGEVTPVHMFSPGDVNTFSSLLITANRNQKPLDNMFVEMVSSSGRYQLRFEGDINNVRNFDYESMNDTYLLYMDKYSNDLETGLLMFINEQIGIDGITLFKMNDDGSTERKTLSSPNVLATNPC